jgi:hypothetical protein
MPRTLQLDEHPDQMQISLVARASVSWRLVELSQVVPVMSLLRTGRVEVEITVRAVGECLSQCLAVGVSQDEGGF